MEKLVSRYLGKLEYFLHPLKYIGYKSSGMPVISFAEYVQVTR